MKCLVCSASFPGSAAAWTYLGMALHDQMRFEEAVAVFQQSLALDPNLAQTYQNMGKSLGRLRRFDEAIACFDRAILLLPTYLNAYKNKARAEYWKGDNEAHIEQKEANAWATLANFHKGSGMSNAWILLTDTLAGGILVLAVTGTLLWSRLHGPRLMAAALIGTTLTASSILMLTTLSLS